MNSAVPALVVGRSAEFAHLGGKPKALQGLIQLGIEPTLGGRDYMIGSNPEFGLSHFLFRGEHTSQTSQSTKYSNCRGIIQQTVRAM